MADHFRPSRRSRWLGSALTVLVLAFYMLLERERLRTAFLSLVPPRHQKRVDETTAEALRTMGGWLRGQAILVLLVTTIISVAMLSWACLIRFFSEWPAASANSSPWSAR